MTKHSFPGSTYLLRLVEEMVSISLSMKVNAFRHRKVSGNIRLGTKSEFFTNCFEPLSVVTDENPLQLRP